jgi:uncharacterized protein (UPF0147 family)
MGSDVLATVNGIAVLVLVVSGTILCLAVTVGLFKLYPSLRRTVSNLEKTTQSTAAAAENAAIISKSIAGRADDIAENIATAAEKARDAMASTAEAAGNIAAASSLLEPVGGVVNIANNIRTGIWGLLTDEQKQTVLSQIKEKLQSLDVSRAVDTVTGRIGGFFRNRRGR